MSSLSRGSPLKWLQLLAVCLTGLLIPLSFTGPAVALPSIHAELGGTPSQLGWIMNAYILSYGSAMMVAGSLTDIHGRRRLWLLGLAWFGLLSFGVGLATDLRWADGLRLLQGLGGAVAFAAAMSSLAPLFEGAARMRAFSLLGTTFGLGLAFGPWVSGLMVDSLGWRWVFHGTGLVALLGLPMVMASARRDEAVSGDRPDWLGAALFTLALGGFTYGVLMVPERGWLHAEVLGPLALSAVLFVVFVAVQRRVARPLLDLSLFSQPRFLGVQLLAASPAFLFISLVVMLPGRFIGVEGLSPLAAGRMMGWLAAPLLVVPLLAALLVGLLSRWISPGRLSAAGLLLATLFKILGGGDHAHAGTQLQAGWQLRLCRGGAAGLAHLLVQQVFKTGTVLLEAGGVGVGEVVGNHRHAHLLRIQSGFRDPQCLVHLRSPVWVKPAARCGPWVR